MFGAAYFGKSYLAGAYFGPAPAGGGPVTPPADEDISYPVTIYYSKRPPPARVSG